MARITFTDALGTATLHNGKDAPGDRFGAWTPDTMPYADISPNLATGLREVFAYRTDATVTFDIRDIPADRMPTMLRLQNWLRSGGLVTVLTEDQLSSTYTCGLASDGDVTIELTNVEGVIEYTLHCTKLLSTTGTDLVCIYQ
jgi:hypothetical protein